jgi:hypothetical protein
MPGYYFYYAGLCGKGHAKQIKLFNNSIWGNGIFNNNSDRIRSLMYGLSDKSVISDD